MLRNVKVRESFMLRNVKVFPRKITVILGTMSNVKERP